MVPILIPLLALPASALLARAAVRLAPRLGLLDVPNERSSHERVTPRGGGLAIVVSVLAGLGALALVFPEHATAWGALAGAGVVVAAVGLMDDRREAPPKVKFAVQMAAAILLMVGSGAIVRVVEVPLVGVVDLGVLSIPLTLFWLVGYANLFNFMDGIDGIAGGHAAVTASFLGLWGLAAGDAVTGWTGLLLAAGALGFLRENRPPARIFMGDVGSLFLGLTIAALAVRASTQDPGVPFPVSFLLLGPFIYDAAFTLGRRIRAGENVLRAHRSHLYQRLVIAGRSHAEVTACYVGLTLVCGGLGTLYMYAAETLALAILLAGLSMMVAFTLLVARIERAGKATS